MGHDVFVENALYWIDQYHMDGLRLDATHTILDDSKEHVLAEIARRVRESVPKDRHVVLLAEDERNEAKLVTPQAEGGTGLDAVWADDFHHEVRVALTGEREGYYGDFSGSASDIAETLNRGWYYQGQRSKYAKSNRGSDASQLDFQHFVYCIQNHDQVGNRALGDRLNSSISDEAYRAASVLLLFSPGTPLLFQGQEWDASTPFLYFTDHNEELGKMVTEGRRSEFAHFEGFRGEEVPDPQALRTFQASKLWWDEVRYDGHATVLEFYRELLAARRQLLPALLRRRDNFRAFAAGPTAIGMRYTASVDSSLADALVIVNLRGKFSIDLAAEENALLSDGRRWGAALYTGEWQLDGANGPIKAQEVVSGEISTDGPAALILASYR